MIIRKLHGDEAYPIRLLMLADPEEEVIQTYISRSWCYVAELEKRVVGIYALLPTRPKTVEIMNIAVDEPFQGKGVGTVLIKHSIQTSKELGYNTIEIGTGNSSIGQLYFYQKCGFRMVGIDRDYFIRHYKEPIFEKGIQCRDMVRMQYDIKR